MSGRSSVAGGVSPELRRGQRAVASGADRSGAWVVAPGGLARPMSSMSTPTVVSRGIEVSTRLAALLAARNIRLWQDTNAIGNVHTYLCPGASNEGGAPMMGLPDIDNLDLAPITVLEINLRRAQRVRVAGDNFWCWHQLAGYGSPSSVGLVRAEDEVQREYARDRAIADAFEATLGDDAARLLAALPPLPSPALILYPLDP